MADIFTTPIEENVERISIEMKGLKDAMQEMKEAMRNFFDYTQNLFPQEQDAPKKRRTDPDKVSDSIIWKKYQIPRKQVVKAMDFLDAEILWDEDKKHYRIWKKDLPAMLEFIKRNYDRQEGVEEMTIEEAEGIVADYDRWMMDNGSGENMPHDIGVVLHALNMVRPLDLRDSDLIGAPIG